MWTLAGEHGEFEYVAEPLTIYHVPPDDTWAEKYEPGRRMFLRLVRTRYGNSAKPLADWIACFFVQSLVRSALRKMDSGGMRGGRCGPGFGPYPSDRRTLPTSATCVVLSRATT